MTNSLSHRRSALVAAFACAAALAFTAAQLHANTIYDAVNDFSGSGNPNGAWSYGTLSSFTGGALNLLTVSAPNSDFPGELLWYNGGTIPNLASVSKNTTGSTETYMSVVEPPNLLRLDGENYIADVRWTAPSTGAYDVAGLFQRIDTGGYPVSVRIIEDGSAALFSANNFSTFNSQQPFDLTNLSLPAGTTLDFAEGAPQYYNDSTGLSATITLVPEPATLTLLGSALLGLGLVYLRRRWVKA